MDLPPVPIFMPSHPMPDLTIIAGCNGSGKSTFAPSLLPSHVSSFDFDKRYLDYYFSMPDSELRETIARNRAANDFEREVDNSLSNKTDFCYETNFDNDPIYWAEMFKKHGFKLNIIFLCLATQAIARRRILIRADNREHYVDNETIDYKWKEGYKNFNRHYAFFDRFLILDNSVDGEIYSNVVQKEGDDIVLMRDKLPAYFHRRFPDIYKLIRESK